jgi:hypothetical protein
MIYTLPWAPLVAVLLAALLLVVVPLVAVTILMTALLVAAMLLAMTLIASAVAIPYAAYRLACRELPRLRAFRVRIPAHRPAAAADPRLQKIP